MPSSTNTGLSRARSHALVEKAPKTAVLAQPHDKGTPVRSSIRAGVLRRGPDHTKCRERQTGLVDPGAPRGMETAGNQSISQFQVFKQCYR